MPVKNKSNVTAEAQRNVAVLMFLTGVTLAGCIAALLLATRHGINARPELLATLVMALGVGVIAWRRGQRPAALAAATPDRCR
jgi:hypothetical protein